MQPFHFEHTRQMSEEEYAEAYGAGISDRFSPLRAAPFAVVATALLFWPYTLLLGVATWGFLALMLTMPSVLRRGAAERYKELPFLRTPHTWGADETGLWVRASDWTAQFAWTQVHGCRVSERWMVITLQSGPSVVLPVPGLREARAYRPVLDMIARQGVKPRGLKGVAAAARERVLAS